uniref:Uncharacterized protein n=1 Tax=Anguilla anguilla TaxID=7936 RepID=A0A0E9U9E7_ANGAN
MERFLRGTQIYE